MSSTGNLSPSLFIPRIELIELLNKIVVSIDSSAEIPISRSEDPAKTGERIADFLKVMAYPSNFEP
jgi:hypothetical protein